MSYIYISHIFQIFYYIYYESTDCPSISQISQSSVSREELTEAQLTNFTQRMASLEVPVIQLEMPPHQAAVFGPHGALETKT